MASNRLTIAMGGIGFKEVNRGGGEGQGEGLLQVANLRS